MPFWHWGVWRNIFLRFWEGAKIMVGNRLFKETMVHQDPESETNLHSSSIVSIPPQIYLWANWHSLQAVGAGCLLFWRVLQQQCVKAIPGLFTSWLLLPSWLQIPTNLETLILRAFLRHSNHPQQNFCMQLKSYWSCKSQHFYWEAIL